MSDLAKNLLTQYYGLGNDTSAKRFLSVCPSIETVHNNGEKLAVEETTLTANGENLSEERESENDINDDNETGIASSAYARSSRVLDDSDDDDENEKSKNFVFDIGQNIMCNTIQDAAALTPKEEFLTNVSPNHKKPFLDISTAEYLEENDSSTCFEDVLPDTGSEISSVFTLRTPQKSFGVRTPSPKIFKKNPVYNKTFADFSNTGLSTFPVEIFDKFSSVKMLYFENNNLIDLPDALFTSLRSLEWLDVRNNQLSTLPITVKFHPSLETLLLQGNNIEKLPLELCMVPKLKTLHVTQNPLIVPPKHIVALGCQSILNFSREEWNKLHPEELVIPNGKIMEVKPSTILCYKSPRREKKPPKDRHQKGSRDIQSVRAKSRSYVPNNRCESSGANMMIEQRLLWISKAKEMINQQALILQKIKDENVLGQWRRDKRSVDKAMQKAINRNEDDIPYAIDFEDYSAVLKRSAKLEKRSGIRRKDWSKIILPQNINRKVDELLESIHRLETTKCLEELTPRAKQKRLEHEIDKILKLQDEIKNLRERNDHS